MIHQLGLGWLLRNLKKHLHFPRWCQGKRCKITTRLRLELGFCQGDTSHNYEKSTHMDTS